MGSTLDNNANLGPYLPPLDDEADSSWFGNDTFAMAASLLAHMAVVLGLALVPVMRDSGEEAVVLVSPPPKYDQELIHQIDEQ